MVGEDRRACDRLPEPAGAEEGDVVLALCPENLADLAGESVDVVTDAALPKFSEPGQVAPDLRRVDVRLLADLLRGDPLLAHLAGLGEDPEILAQPRGHPDGEPVAVTGLLDAFERDRKLAHHLKRAYLACFPCRSRNCEPT